MLIAKYGGGTVEGALKALRIRADDVANQPQIAAEGGIGMAIAAMREHAGDEGVQREGCHALWYIAYDNGSEETCFPSRPKLIHHRTHFQKRRSVRN